MKQINTLNHSNLIQFIEEIVCNYYKSLNLNQSIKIKDFEGEMYYVFEYCPKSLKDIINQQNKLNANEIIEYFNQIGIYLSNYHFIIIIVF